jgi:hypothetical protein
MSCPAALFPGNNLEKIVYQAGCAPELVWTCVENLAPWGFSTQTVQTVGSCYTNYVIPALKRLDMF